MSSPEFQYKVAFSFAGNHKRDRIRAIAELVRAELGDGYVFFDEWFMRRIAGVDAHHVLQTIYRHRTWLIVSCLCQYYNDKPWTQEERRAIESFERTLRDAATDNVKRLRLLPLRFGDGDVDGLFDTAIVPDVRNDDPNEVARLILERFEESHPPTDWRAPALSSREAPSPDERIEALRAKRERLRQERRKKIADAIAAEEAAWLRLRLCEPFGLEETATPEAIAASCEKATPDELLEIVEDVSEHPPAGGRATLARWVRALLPQVLSLRGSGEDVADSLFAGTPILLCHGYSYAIAECMAAAVAGQAADFIRDGSALDSVHRLEVKATAMTGRAQAKEVSAAIQALLASYAERKKYRGPQDPRVVEKAMAIESRKRAKRRHRQYLVVFREGDVDARFAEDFKAEMESAKIDLDVLYLRAPNDDITLTIEAHMLETIAPLFDKAAS